MGSMESRKINYISKSGYISTCSSWLEVNLYIDKMFPAKDADYFLPEQLFFKPYKLVNLNPPKELAENKLYVYFCSLNKVDVFSLINMAIVECLKIDSTPNYNIERAMALCSIRISVGGSGYEICYSALYSLWIFTIVYALLYINNKEEQLDHIISCIKQQSETDNTDFFDETFLQVKKYIESNKSSLSFKLPKPYFYEDELDEVDWLVETCNYSTQYLKAIANSNYEKHVKMLVLGKILKSYRRDRDIDYNLKKLDAESFLESELSLLYSNNEVQITYPTQLMQRRIITDTIVCKWFVQEFLLSYFSNCPFEDIQRVFLGFGDGKLIPLTAKKGTKKGDIALVICYLCQGEKVKEETLTYFKKMIKDSNGDSLFTGVNPLSAAKNKDKFYKSVSERMRNRIGGNSFESYKKNISWLSEEG